LVAAGHGVGTGKGYICRPSADKQQEIGHLERPILQEINYLEGFNFVRSGRFAESIGLGLPSAN
jgi:hypothetical protein